MKRYTFLSIILIFLINLYQPFSYRVSDEKLPGDLQRFITNELLDTNVLGPTVMMNGENFRFSLAEPIRAFYLKISPLWLDLFLFKGSVNNAQENTKNLAHDIISKKYGKPTDIISVHPGRLSGTSTGLAYSLAYISATYKDFLQDNQKVLATGVISYNGRVFSVGALDAKLKNSEINSVDFIIGPANQISTIRKEYFKNHNKTSTVFFGVNKITEAVDAICFFNNNHKKPCSKKTYITLPSENIHICSIVYNNKKTFCSWSVDGRDIIIKFK
jgi:hypothetical protein